MNLRFKFTATWFWALVLGLLIGNASVARAGEANFEAQLVWATNDEKPPKEEYKPVDPETRKKLESLGLKWKNFYLVKKTNFETKNGESGKVATSEKSSLAIKLLADKKVEVVFYGKKGEECSRRTQPLKAGEMLVHGGNVPENATAWLVTLKRVK
jgi:hypothetical protein